MAMHLTDEQLDVLALFPARLEESERGEAQSHVSRCSLCSERLRMVMAFRDEYARELAKGPGPEDVRVAGRIAARTFGLQLTSSVPVSTHRFEEELSEQRRGFVARMAKTIVRHPVVAAGSAGLLIAALYLFVSITPIRGSLVPDHAAVKDGILTVYTSEGTSIWTKHGTSLMNGSTRTGFVPGIPGIDSRTPVLIGDVHPSTGKEVLIRGTGPLRENDGGFSTDSIYCFSAGGELLWTSGYGIEEFSGFKHRSGGWWRLAGMFLRKSSNEQHDRLFIHMYLEPFSPSALLEVDGRSGVRLQQFCNFGNILRVGMLESSGQGVDRIVIAGINNAYNRAFVAAFHPDSISGFGPVPSAPGDFGYSGSASAHLLSYVLLPRTVHAQRFADIAYNTLEHVWISDGGTIVAQVNEFPVMRSDSSGTFMGSVLYSFDKDMKVSAITFSDEFFQTHDMLLQRGETLPPLDESYKQDLRSRMTYWNGRETILALRR